MLSNTVTITDIRRTKKGHNALFSRRGFLFSVDDLELEHSDLHIGSCLTQQELSCVAARSENSKAVEKCYTLLSYRPHGKRELYNKLLKYFDGDTARYAVDKMEELSLIDDEAFAAAKAEYLLCTKGASLAAVRAKLLSLGIDREVTDRVLSRFGIDSQVEEIVNLINKKYASKLSRPDKVAASLQRKGFKPGEIRRAMRQIDIEIQEY